MRTGIQLEGRHYRADDTSNYLGTYIFSSSEDFLPASRATTRAASAIR